MIAFGIVFGELVFMALCFGLYWLYEIMTDYGYSLASYVIVAIGMILVVLSALRKI